MHALKLASPTPAAKGPPLTVAQESLIGYRYGLVQDWRQMCIAFERAGAAKMSATREFLARHPGVSKSTLYHWDKLLRDDLRKPPEQRAGLRVLLDHRTMGGRSRCGTNGCGTGVSPVEDDPAWRFFKSVYNAMPPQTVVTCWHIARAEADKQGWAWPSLRTVQLRVAEPAFQVHSTFFRLGEREWSRRYGHQIPRNYDAYRAGEWLMSDFHQADVFCRRSESDPRIVRPLISATIDIRSRKVHLHVCLHENQREVLAGLAGWIRANGAPNHWTIDNGKPYRSLGISGGKKRIDNEDYVRSVAGQLGIAVHFSIDHNPNGKACMERFFGTLESQVRPRSWCGPHQDDVFKAAHKLSVDHPEQCLTVAEYAALVEQWVTEVYHARPHGGECMDGLTPDQAFERFDPIPLAVAPEGVLDQLLMLTSKAKVTNLGVLYRGVHYSNYDGLFAHMGSTVLLRIPQGDAGRVIVCDLKTGAPLCEAVNARLQLVGADHDHVAQGMRTKQRAKRLMKEVRAADIHAAHRSVAENAIAARAQEQSAVSSHQSASATGTDGCGTGGLTEPGAPPVSPVSPVSPRNVRPLRPDMLDALARAQDRAQTRARKRATSPRPAEAPLRLEDIYADEPAAHMPGPAASDVLEELYGA